MSNTPSRFRRKERRDSMTFPVDPNDAAKLLPLQRAHTDAAEALKLLAENDGSKAAIKDAQGKLDAAKAELDAGLADCPTVTFHLRALSGVQLQAIQSDNPPTKDQIASAKVTDPTSPPPDYNPETYPPALLAAACTGVEWSDGEKADKLTPAEATDFYESSSFGDQQQIMTVIALVNQLPSRVEALGKG
jgi:hypothetical protein